MTAIHDSSTRHSLLASLVRGDSASKSWPIFVEKYGMILHAWSMRWGASEHEAEEVVQETLITIYRKLELYQKMEGVHFRAWLKKVAYRCWLAVLKTRGDADPLHPVEAPSAETLRRLARPEARADLLNEFDLLATEEILEFARQRVQARVEPSTWKCFELCGMANHASREVAARLDMTQAAVIKAVSRVRRMLREEIDTLDPPEI